MKFFATLIIWVLGSIGVFGAIEKKARVSVAIVSDEAEAVLDILRKRADGVEITDADWLAVFESEGYRRLKKRELSLSRPFEEGDFRTFVMSEDLLARREALAATLERWEKIDATAAGNKALNYLPRQATISAKIYPVIKPRDNSFVFEIKTDPAIFLYLDQNVSREKFENTLTHELHHIGFGTACPSPDTSSEIEKLPDGTRNALRWIGAFGEGLAMLAAAGELNIHPHISSDAKERSEWDASMANFDADLRKVEGFLIKVASGKLSGEEETKAGFAFFGVQGPWYTVGWKMASVIEKEFGREKLIDTFCDQRRLLRTYNSAAKRHAKRFDVKLATWSEDLAGRFD
ncbi:MAG TPA: DUF5700 domain-containing putative Zn-dependent protease [Pyrinomonadaceae bacterium]